MIEAVLALGVANLGVQCIALWQRHQTSTLARQKRLKKARKRAHQVMGA